jgi:hypothetical protein
MGQIVASMGNVPERLPKLIRTVQGTHPLLGRLLAVHLR